MREVLPTASDVREIFFKVQRKKNVIPEHANLTWKYNREIMLLLDRIDFETDTEEVTRKQEELRILLQSKRDHEDVVFNDLRNKLESKILQPPKSIRLQYRKINGRTVTTFNKDRAGLMLFDRFVSQHLTRAFGVRTNGRDQCMRVLINTFKVSSTAPAARQGVLKLDIKEFYASIDHKILLGKIEKNAGVPRFVKQHVRLVLAAYARLYNCDKGIPDGVPSSAVLAEIYLEKFDSTLRRNPDIALFMRYVDDIVIVTDPEFLEDIDKQVSESLKLLGVEKNLKKSNSLVHPLPNESSLEYLGYKFIFEKKTSKLKAIDISDEKMDRYINGLERMSRYAGEIDCWASKDAVDMYLGCFDYLFRPHATTGAGQGMRIVTGLAYSSRFMSGTLQSRPNFKRLLNCARKEFKVRWGRLDKLNVSGGDVRCKCCHRPIPRWGEIRELLEKSGDPYEVMGSTAKTHENEDMRNRIGGILWN